MSLNEKLLYIEDDDNRKLYYRFTPAALVSNFVPLIIILDEEEGINAAHFEYKMWNILTPIDKHGFENKGSYWLGENGDFFVRDLLQKLIKNISEEYECEDHIYLYGSSMGGYGAILHGMLCNANAVYAHNPHISVREKHLTDTVTKENDLYNFLNPTDDFPIFFLCEEADSLADTREPHIENEITSFVNVCKKYDITYRLDPCPKSGNSKEQEIKEVLDMLERVSSQI